MNSHLNLKDLLHFVDGELSHWRKRRVAEHIESCWTCLRSLERLERDIDTILDAQEYDFFPSVAPPPRSWPSVDQIIGSGAERSSFLHRLPRSLKPPASYALRYAVALTIVVCVVATVLWFFPQRLSASEVFQKAKDADERRFATSTNQVVRQRLRVDETDRRTHTKRSGEFESWKTGQRTLWRVDDRSVGKDFEQLYHRKRVEMDLPLAPATYSKWFESSAAMSAARHGGEVEVTADGGSVDIESVRLTVRQRDWHVESMEITFSDVVFDITEIDLTTLRKDEVSAAIMALLEPPFPALAASAPVIREGRTPVSPPVADAGVDLSQVELDARTSLHEIGADLREPITIAVQGSEVVVRAWALSGERKRQLVELFLHRPHVRVESDPPPAAASTAQTSVAILPSASPVINPDDRIAKWLGGAQAQESWARSVLARNSAILSRLYALNNLGERWPPDVEARLPQPAQAQLRAMAGDHANALASEVPDFVAEVKPLLNQFCPTQGGEPPSEVTPQWQLLSSAALESAQNLGRVLRGLLTTSTDLVNLESGCLQVKASVSALDAQVRTLSTAL